MKPVQLAILIGITFLFVNSIEGRAEVCHMPEDLRTNGGTSVTNFFVIKEVEAVPNNRTNLNAYYHPYGTLEINFLGNIIPLGGPVWEDSCGIGDNENAGYQLKIFSKQDPRTDLFDKPILITQGFDVRYGTKAQFNFDEFTLMLDRVFENDDMTKEARDETSLLKTLYAEGYDIALLRWKNPTIDIEINAKVTLQALRWLQKHTIKGEGTEPVIIGPSMGGLVTRNALQLAGANRANDIRARLLIAFDSPNLGAEIPMSIQALASYLRDQSDDIYGLFTNLTSIAARQMLLSSVVEQETGTVFQEIIDYEEKNCRQDNQLPCVHGKFMQQINNPEFRGNIKNIVHTFAGTQKPIHTVAIINGSSGVRLGLPEGAPYIEASYGVLGKTLGGYELRTARAKARVRVTHVDRRKKNQLNYDFYEPAFMEDAPGGLRPTYLDIRNSLQASKFPPNRFIDVSVVNHSFIPSLSGVGLLDLIGGINDEASWLRGVGTAGTCTVGPTCMFDEFHAPVSNQGHVTVTRENKQWFLDLIHTYGPPGPRPPVQPIWEGACALNFDTLRSSFGYNNSNAFNVTVPIGVNNQFLGTDPSQGQPEIFLPGRHHGVVRITGSAAWNLDGTTAELKAPPLGFRPCSSKPILEQP